MRASPAPRTPLALRACLRLVRAVSFVVPRAVRRDWVQEWEAEIQHRWSSLGRRGALTRASQVNLVRRTTGAVLDAAWLRQQFTLDAEVIQDVRHGGRLLRASPGFAVVAVLALGLGIGANAAIFTVIDNLLLRALPYDEPGRVVTLWQTRREAPGDREEVSPANFLDWRTRARAFSHVAGADPWSLDYTGGVEPEVIHAARVTEGFFEAVGVRALHGRTFLSEEYETGRDNVVLLGEGIWRSRFGGDVSLVGRHIILDGVPHTVVGIMPSSFDLRLVEQARATQAWRPRVITEEDLRARGGGWWTVVARLKPGVTAEQAGAEMDGVAAGLEQEYPANAGVGAAVTPLRDHLVGPVRPALYVLASAAILVLLVACGNVANLLLARGAVRRRELAVRAALGASRARLIRQLLAESLLLSTLGALAGLALASWGIDLIVALAPNDVTPLGRLAVDARVTAFAVALAALTTIVFGLAPALQLARPDLRAAVEQSGGNRVAGSSGRLRAAVAVAEISLALVLLVGAGLLVRSFSELLSVDPGFRKENVLAAQVFAWDRQPTAEERDAFFREAIERIEQLPGVAAAAAASAPPFMTADMDIGSPLGIQGRPVPPGGQQPRVSVNIVTPRYFEVLGIPLREGRAFTVRDTATSPAVAIVNDTVARRHWPGASPIGQRIGVRWHGRPITAEVVGVAGHVRHTGLDLPARPEVFLPHALTAYGSMTFVVRTAVDPGTLTQPVKAQIWTLDPLMTFYEIATLDKLVDRTLSGRRSSLVVVAFLSLVALLLAAVGIYGVLSVTTAQRTKEFGIRLALGATGGDIVRLVLRHGLLLAFLGVGIGFAGALAVTRFLASLLFGVTPRDPAAFGLGALLVVVVTLVACYLPARRATRVDPLRTLRVE